MRNRQRANRRSETAPAGEAKVPTRTGPRRRQHLNPVGRRRPLDQGCKRKALSQIASHSHCQASPTPAVAKERKRHGWNMSAWYRFTKRTMGPDGRLNLAGVRSRSRKRQENAPAWPSNDRLGTAPEKLQIGQCTRHPELYRTAGVSIVPVERKEVKILDDLAHHPPSLASLTGSANRISSLPLPPESLSP